MGTEFQVNDRDANDHGQHGSGERLQCELTMNGVTSHLPVGFFKFTLRDICVVVGLFFTGISFLFKAGATSGSYVITVDNQIKSLTSTVSTLADAVKLQNSKIVDMDDKGTTWGLAEARYEAQVNAEQDRIVHNLESSVNSMGRDVTETKTNVTLLLNYFKDGNGRGK